LNGGIFRDLDIASENEQVIPYIPFDPHFSTEDPDIVTDVPFNVDLTSTYHEVSSYAIRYFYLSSSEYQIVQ